MNCLSKLNTKTFVAAALLAGAGVTFASVGVAKGYNLSPLETYIIESFAQEQIDGFINSGATTLFESPKIFYLNPRAFAKQAKTDLSALKRNISVITESLNLLFPGQTRRKQGFSLISPDRNTR